MARGEEAEVGFSKLAHALRRSTAAYIAMVMTPEGGTLEDWESTADRVAAWIGGRAVVEEEQPEEAQDSPGDSLGVPWSERDA